MVVESVSVHCVQCSGGSGVWHLGGMFVFELELLRCPTHDHTVGYTGLGITQGSNRAGISLSVGSPSFSFSSRH
jgi:hypothetical protein